MNSRGFKARLLAGAATAVTVAVLGLAAAPVAAAAAGNGGPVMHTDGNIMGS
ncbi:hypothetical protein GCM10023194_09820 [Planotetraspora phitsanulokensis]|uniref:Uncharacterized protein n=1 Tax=Planotetraspora phitsanulokensis TaxID=575192 RepID=A0A8J3U1K8_9ACTN|nr:hypothetical protein [Planotetraspora phitsanulokensis]GII35262.1 hypothetical protein Pph01_02650 [Planotetraspora phitsanulokensis]